MEGIEKITGRIADDARAEARATLDEAKARAAEIAADYDRRAKSEGEAILQKGEANAKQREERLAGMAQMEGRKLRLGAKQEMVEQAFEKAMSDLTSLPDEAYIALLARLAAQAARTGREQVVLSQKDRTRFGKQIVSAANELLAKKVAPKLPDELAESKAGAFLDKAVTVASALFAGTGMLTLSEESRPMAGGLVLKDDKVETNCTFETLIHLEKESLAADVAKVLFA